MRTHRVLGAVAVIGLLSACGSGDDAEPAAEQTVAVADESSAQDEPDDEGTADGSDADQGGDAADEPDEPTGDGDEGDVGDDDGNTVSVGSLDDIPEECREIMGDFLREIEPIVSDIDWENATMADLEQLGTSIDAPVNEIDAEMEQAGCNDIDFNGDDERGFELSLELAREEAPGVVGWLEFIRDVSSGFDLDATPDESAGAPEDCDEALAAVRELMSSSDSMMELPVDDLLAASSTIQATTSLCSVDEMAALFNDPDFQAWSEG